MPSWIWLGLTVIKSGVLTASLYSLEFAVTKVLSYLCAKAVSIFSWKAFEAVCISLGIFALISVYEAVLFHMQGGVHEGSKMPMM